VLGLLCEKTAGWYVPILVCILAIYASRPLFTESFFRKGVWRCLWIAAVFCGGIWHMQSQTAFRNEELAQIQQGEAVSLCGEIYKKEIKNDQFLVYLKNCYAVSKTEQIACNNVLLYQTSDDFSIGDILYVNGKVNMFRSAANEGAFDAKSYYFSQKIDFAVKDAAVMLAESAADPVPEYLWRLRRKIASIYTEATDAITAGVLSVMILGEKSTLDAEVKELYQSMGISHILAISGLHVSLIGLGIYRFLRRRGMRYGRAFVLSGVLLILYAIMTGNSVSTMRAVGMLFLLMLADVWGRAYDSVNALGAMILVLLWENPFLLEYAGFVLSAAAVLGVATVGNAIQMGERDDKIEMTRVAITEDGKMEERAAGRLHGAVREDKRDAEKSSPKRKNYAWKMLNAAYMGVGIWLFTLPLIAYYYYEIPLYSALLNLFVVPLLKYLILLGAAGAAVGIFGTKMTSIVLFPCRLILDWYDIAASTCLKLPFAKVIVGKPSQERMILYYALLAGVAVIWSKKKEKHWVRLLGVAAVMCVLLFPVSREFELDVLDVGQGDGTYICTEEGISLFIDGGSTSTSSVGTYQILPFLKSKGIRSISYWFVSHADEDHISGLVEVLESGYTVENLVVANRTVQDDSRASLLELAQSCGTSIICMKTGDVLSMGQTQITCLAPDADNTYEDRNDGGLVLLYRDADFSGMFAGDISSEIEEEIVENFDALDVDFYKADHHGSKYSSGELWLAALAPEITSISCSSTNTYGHPHSETLERLEKAGTDIYRTDELGAIKIKKDNGSLMVSGLRSD
jgi:competence protein ComEC